MIISEGGDPNLALEELVQLGYETYALNGNEVERDFILQKPLIRIVAARTPAGGAATR